VPATPAEPPGYPSWLSRDVALLDGQTVFVRPVLPADLDELRRAIAHADAITVRSRFLGGRPPSSDQDLARLVNLDYDRRLAVLALSPDGRGVGIARYEAESGADIAEVAVAVDPAWRHIGLATALVRLLAAGAVRNGVLRFSADFFDANLDVHDLFADTGLDFQTTAPAAGVVTAEVMLPTDPADLL
jgi:GNAT superfamily N-acetyltransferase